MYCMYVLVCRWKISGLTEFFDRRYRLHIQCSIDRQTDLKIAFDISSSISSLFCSYIPWTSIAFPSYSSQFPACPRARCAANGSIWQSGAAVTGFDIRPHGYTFCHTPGAHRPEGYTKIMHAHSMPLAVPRARPRLCSSRHSGPSLRPSTPFPGATLGPAPRPLRRCWRHWTRR